MPTSVPLQPTLTEAGVAAVFNAQSTGLEFVISHIAFGTAQYVPDGSEIGLRVEKVRVPIAGGGRISPTQIQIYAVAMAAAGNPFFVGEIGFFGNNGTTLLAVYSSTGTPSLYLSDTVATSVSYALGLAALPANSVTVTIDPSASAALLIMGNHVAAADPHPQYVQKVNGVAFYDPTVTFNNGAQIIGDDLLVYQSTQANNIGHTPSSSPSWWVPLYNYGNTPVTGLAAANVTLSSTQAARAHITLSGALTAPINVVFPNWVKDWTVVNNTTGAFSLTCQTAAGAGVVIPQNGAPTKIRGDGANITQPSENVAAATEGHHAVQFQQLQAALGGFAGVSLIVGSTTILPVAANNAFQIAVGSVATATLPSANSVPSYSTLTFYNQGPATLNIAPPTGSILYNGASIASLPIAPGATLVVMSRGIGSGEWDAVAGSALLQYSATAVGPATSAAHAVQLQQALAMRGNYSSFIAMNVSPAALTAAQVGAAFDWYGAVGTLNLPAVASAVTSNGFSITNTGSGNLTVVANGADQFVQAAASSVVVPPGGSMSIVAANSGTQWVINGGSVGLQYGAVSVGTATAPTHAVQKQQLGNMQGAITVNANTVLTAIQAGSYVQISSGSGLTVTLPPTAPGAAFPIYNNTNATHTLKGNGSQVINNGSGNSNTYTILPWAAIWAISDGASFSIISGAGDVLLTTNGWERKPSGLIECWAQGTTNSSGTVTITLPITFPNSQLIGMVCGQNGTAVAACVTLQSLSTSQIIVNAVNGSASPINGLQVNIRALGK